MTMTGETGADCFVRCPRNDSGDGGVDSVEGVEKVKLRILATVFAAFLLTSSAVSAEGGVEQKEGWLFPTIGQGRGHWEAGVGLFLSKEEIKTRNFQIRADVDLGPGLRLHTVTRSNREQDSLRGFSPHLDEGYVEGYGFHESRNGTFSTSLRVGNVRYLHFPYPDSIAVFDQVPGVSDLSGGAKTGYSGELLTVDYKHKSGLGLHATGINWGFGRDGGSQMIENYVYFHHNFGAVHFETHVGGLAVRPEPLGRKDNGYNVFFGTKVGSYQVGFLHEKLKSQSAYTGIMVTFPQDRVTRALGGVAFDYDRNPEGFAMQVPLANGKIGSRIAKKAPANGILVGEIKAERIRTYWQNGHVRNFYEHRLAAWGEENKAGLVMVVEEQPWYLQAEALVSPHTSLGSWSAIKAWEKDRQGPAQLSQTVTYKFYRMP